MQPLDVTVFRLSTGRWTWDAAANGQVLAVGNDYDRPKRAAEAAAKVTGRSPVIDTDLVVDAAE